VQVGDRVKLNPEFFGSVRFATRCGTIKSRYKIQGKKKAWDVLWDANEEVISYWESDLSLIDDTADYKDDFE
jgi:hypothetical protein